MVVGGTSCREWVELNFWGIWILLSSSSHPRIQTLEWRSIIFAKAFQEHFLSLPSFSLLTIAEKSPEHPARLSTCWGLLCTLDNQKANGSGVFFFSWKHKIYTTINKKIYPDELTGLLSQMMLSVNFTPYLFIPTYFPGYLYRKHNSLSQYCGKCFLPFDFR